MEELYGAAKAAAFVLGAMAGATHRVAVYLGQGGQERARSFGERSGPVGAYRRQPWRPSTGAAPAAADEESPQRTAPAAALEPSPAACLADLPEASMSDACTATSCSSRRSGSECSSSAVPESWEDWTGADEAPRTQAARASPCPSLLPGSACPGSVAAPRTSASPESEAAACGSSGAPESWEDWDGATDVEAGPACRPTPHPCDEPAAFSPACAERAASASAASSSGRPTEVPFNPSAYLAAHGLETLELLSAKPLGKGAYGKAFLCRVPLPDGSDVTAVLKRMHRTAPKDVVLNEVAAMKRLRGCGGCVQLLAHGKHGGRRALLLEYCAGRSLADRLEQQAARCGSKPTGLLTPVPALRELAAQLLRGLANVHALGVVHQDIKPDNLLFDEAGELRIADFGTAAPRMDNGLYATAGAGSRTYMAPEALALVDGKPCEHPITDKADVFSAGATLLQAAWLHTDPAFRYAFMRGLHTAVPPFVPPSTMAFLLWLTHPDPRVRPSAREALESDWLRGCGEE